MSAIPTARTCAVTVAATELKWRFGYLYFWLVVVGAVGGLLYLLRRSRLL